MLRLKGDLHKTKGTPKNFDGSLNENTAILENVVTKLQIWGVLETKITPCALFCMHEAKKKAGQRINKDSIN